MSNQQATHRVALAIFAKTIGLSPVKTRLAETIGEKKATEFYAKSLAAVAQVVQEAVQIVAQPAAQTAAQKITARGQIEAIVPYWAVAEAEAVKPYNQTVSAEKPPYWVYARDNLATNFAALWTGNGDLGQRLAQVYQALQPHYDAVIMIGTDSPQLIPDQILQAHDKLKQQHNNFVVGPAYDGGFYLFGAAQPIAPSVWTAVNYSVAETCQMLCAQLLKKGLAKTVLPVAGDVDVFADLLRLRDELSQLPRKNTAQQALFAWLCDELPDFII
ncbi:TIGR04282 family arsenosugar biosynthesis glycosyltransferase [Ostreibacterium oceani]|uniref:DUF2064 domain-containing protein n=1 Tax=Ostreibacterium oceani TaxID=2654998 RepID=A0A6N7EXC7_9GAMM|nr:DUF2064 domain-containing protein [Ostreibacterium oceani]MPV85787.1 DUF2064 domain-containing protein [Ostreibacterium oceani]